MAHATVQVPAFHERKIHHTLREIRDQEVSKPWTFNVEAWVTPNSDPCTTMALAESVDGVDVYEAPKGKLSARNEAHTTAAARGADVIVQWDADAPPLEDRSLDKLLAHLLEDGVVGVSGWASSRDSDLLSRAVSIQAYADWFVLQPFYGRFSAFTADAWRQVGPFPEDIDQTGMGPMRAVEEIGFRRELRQVGRVVDAFDARVHLDDRRFRCYLNPLMGKPQPSYCAERGGTETFEPETDGKRRI